MVKSGLFRNRLYPKCTCAWEWVHALCVRTILSAIVFTLSALEQRFADHEYFGVVDLDLPAQFFSVSVEPVLMQAVRSGSYSSCWLMKLSSETFPISFLGDIHLSILYGIRFSGTCA